MAVERYASAGGGGRVYRSVDGGRTFTDISRVAGAGNVALPNSPVYALAVDTNDSNFSTNAVRPVYVGTDLGVYSTQDNGRHWVRDDGNSLPIVKVTALQVFPQKHQLVAATYGEGVWASPLTGNAAVAAEGQLVSAANLGRFTDTLGSGPYTVIIDKGDGSPLDTTSGHVTTSASGNTVSGDIQYARAGVYQVTTTVSNGSSSEVLTRQFVVQPAALTGSSASISGSAWTTLSNTLVGTFTDANNYATSPADFQVVIDWGDGTTSAGTVSYASGTFSVRGTHSYNNAGTFTITVTVESSSGAATVLTSTATISGTVAATALPVTATQGTSTGSVPFASFTASDHGPFSATIDWGDGHQSSGTVTVNNSGGYTVSGSTTYALSGDSFPITVRIYDNGTLAAVVSGDATVNPAGLSGLGLPVAATQGTPLSGVTVARVSDANLAANLSAYTATIDWGDGEGGEVEEPGAQSEGTIVPEAGGTFAVVGDYTYLRPGSYSVTITVDGPGGSQTIRTTAAVTRAAPQVSSVSNDWGGPWGPPQGGTLVTISGANLYDATAVNFGSTPATAFTVNDDGTITAIAPALSAGSYHVSVTTPYGSSASSSADLFTVASAAAPTVTGLGTTSGPSGGGNSISVSGTNIASTTAVTVGGSPADFTIASDSQQSMTGH